jgi:phosphoribosylanthranilate isomerase
MTKVKICGINDRAAYAAARAADYVGLNFFPRSPRYVTPDQAAAIAPDDGPLKVGLFVSPNEMEIAAALEAVRLDVLQLYADPAACRAMRARFGLPVWRAVGVSIAADLPGDAEGLDGFVIEAKAPKGATRPGGNAAVLDWSIVKGWQAPAPWLLAGGLTPANVAQAIAASDAPGVDVSSGVEEAPGRKSPKLIRDFITASRHRP